MFVLGAGAGLAVTVLGLFRAFSAIEYADPAAKSGEFSEAISMSMTATAAGAVVAGLGVGVLVVGLFWMLLRHLSKRAA